MIQDRLKEIRNDVGLTQELFGKKIGLKRVAYSKYEQGLVKPSTMFIKQVASQFFVNEHWLETGEGEKYIEDREQAQFTNKIADLIKNKDDKTKEIMFKLAELNEDDFNAVAYIINSLAERE